MIIVPPVTAAKHVERHTPTHNLPLRLPDPSRTALPQREQRHASLRSEADPALDHSNGVQGNNGFVKRVSPDVHLPLSTPRSAALTPPSPRNDQQGTDAGRLAGTDTLTDQSPTQDVSRPAVCDKQGESTTHQHRQVNQSLHRPSGRPPAAANRGSVSSLAAGTAANKRKASTGACHHPRFIDVIDYLKPI